MRRLLNGVVSVTMLAALAACGGGEQQTEQQPADTTPAATPQAPAGGGAQLPPGVTPEMVAEGDAIFHGAGLCMTCHGADAKGTTLGPDLTDDQWLNITGRNYDEIVNVVTNGVLQPRQYPAPMPARGGSTITDEQVRAVAAYVYQLGGT